MPFFTAKQLLVNDLHRHVINLYLVVQNAEDREWLKSEADGIPYHPEALAAAQRFASRWEWKRMPSREAALFYFVCVWMGRGGQAGTPGETKGALPIRWNANGGGSNRRVAMYISNLSPAELADLFDDRIVSRLTAGSVLKLTGPDRRMTP